MKDFLPILIGLIWLGFTLYNKSQKSKKSRSGETTIKRKPSMLEQLLLGEQFNAMVQPETESIDHIYEENEETVEKKALKTEPVESFKEQSSFLSYKLSNFVEEGGKNFIKENDNYNMDHEIAYAEKRGTQLIDFDLRRAVIYSEILNAPYI
jgi:hypothetical protein